MGITGPLGDLLPQHNVELGLEVHKGRGGDESHPGSFVGTQ